MVHVLSWFVVVRHGSCFVMVRGGSSWFVVVRSGLTFFWPAEFPGYHQCQQESQ